jgi:hypothetical protein
MRIRKLANLVFLLLKRTKLQEDTHRLILWTYKCGVRLEEAVEFCKNNGVEFYAINKSFPKEQFDYTKSRKIHADLLLTTEILVVF